jgi:murein L,D-transpeptidase YafK
MKGARHAASWPLLVALCLLASCVAKPPESPPPQPIAFPAKANRVLVLKAFHKLYLMRDETVLYSFPIALGRHPDGTKMELGDQRTPEGRYMLDWRNPNSLFYRSIHISYPNAEDAARAEARGVLPGGDVMIHGLPQAQARMGARHAATDWTDGCIAVTNEEMDIIWRLVDDNTPIEIRP